MNVLITSLGSNTSIGVIKALKFEFPLVKIIGTDTNNQAECNGIAFCDKFYKICRSTEEDFIHELLRIIKFEDIHCIIPIHDKEIEIISNYLELIVPYTKIALNNSRINEICNNKLKCSAFIEDICISPTYYGLDNVQLPAILKEINGIGSVNIQKIDSRHNLPLKVEDDFVLQEYISGKEYTVDCFSSYFNEAFKCVVRVRNEIKSGMSTKGTIISHPKIEELCMEIISKLNYKGVANIQFIENENDIYFIELNPRFAGGGILTYLNGFNIPAITIKELVLNDAFDIKRDFNPKIGTKMVRYFEETFINSNGYNL
ncbi:MAG: ATP-grasp domain-containing protein [Crocinitomicaceae bacterium]|jgi:carbamoyl-phosphate synthase large subunit|nr:ATP-grasp domain-containing protein [Crocinitomicaceae bacterium]